MSSMRGTHEEFSREKVVEGSSDRSFGIVFAVVFTITALFPLIRGGGIRVWSLVVAGIFLLLALLLPGVLAPLNRLWFKFGMLLHRIVSPVVLGLLFYVGITPMSFLMRIAGKRPLDLDFDRAAKSYWIVRDPPGPAPESMKNQF
jgi:hypothetical protein